MFINFLIDDDDCTLERRVKCINDVRKAMLEAGTYTPFIMNDRAMKELILTARNHVNVEKCFKFFGTKSSMKISGLIKKRVRQSEGKEKKKMILAEREEMDHLNYGIGLNTIHLRVYPNSNR